MLGTVKFFNKDKGYGFIKSEEGVEHFVHFSEIDMDGYKELKENENVQFEPASAEKGPIATKVKPVA